MSRARLSRATWLLIAGESVSAVGTGLVLPLTLIYLHQVRGIALPEVGALMAAIGAVGLIAVPLTGIALDRFGARPVLFAVLSGQALAEGGLAWDGKLLTVTGDNDSSPRWPTARGGVRPGFGADEVAQAGGRPVGSGECPASVVEIASVALHGHRD